MGANGGYKQFVVYLLKHTDTFKHKQSKKQQLIHTLRTVTSSTLVVKNL